LKIRITNNSTINNLAMFRKKASNFNRLSTFCTSYPQVINRKFKKVDLISDLQYNRKKAE